MTSHPVFGGIRNPLGSGYPASSLVKGKLSTSKHALNAATGKRGSKSAVQDEYVKNLQQQIYLLELETRYLKAPGSAPIGPTNAQLQAQAQLAQAIASGNPAAIAASKHSLNMLSMTSLREPLNTQDNDLIKVHEQIDKLKSDKKHLELTIKDLEKDKTELLRDTKALKDRHVSEKDKIYGDLITFKKKSETAESDAARIQVSLDRISQDKSQLEHLHDAAQEEIKKYKDLVNEQIQINKTLKDRIEDLQSKNSGLQTELHQAKSTISNFHIDEFTSRIKGLEADKLELQTKIKQMETIKLQEDHLKKRIESDCQDLVKANVALKSQLDELTSKANQETEAKDEKKRKSQEQIKEDERVRNELARLSDDFQMLKISSEMKEKQLNESAQQTKTLESNLHKVTEARNLLLDKVNSLETRIRNQELEIIQLGQDKSLLIDDVAELRNTADVRTHKIKTLTSDNKRLGVELDKCKRDLAQIREFSSILEQVETNGQNYLQLMRNLKTYLATNNNNTHSSESTDDS